MSARGKPRLRPAAVPAVFAAGAVLGTLWDQLHVRAETLSYASPTVAGQPWWVPVEFGAAFVAGAYATAMLGDPAPRRQSLRIAGIETSWITAVYASTAFFHRWPWALAALLAIALAVRGGVLATLVPANLVPAIAIVVAGPLTEAMLITAGVFEYRTSQIGPIPVWLPLLWANGVVFMIRLTEAALQVFGVRRVTEPATAVVPPNEPPNEPVPDS